MTGKNVECYCGNRIAFDFVARFILSKSCDSSEVRIAICSDREVSGYYYNQFEEQFLRNGFKPVFVLVDSRTKYKGLTMVDTLYKSLVDFSFGSNDWIIALGGGSVLDICGFASSVFTGKINYLAVPTTLNAMVSCIQSKNAFLNASGYKNEIAVPLKPYSAIVDPTFLKTLSDKVRAGGYSTLIRLALLDNIDILRGLVEQVDMRVFLNSVFISWSKVEDRDERLLTLGEVLASSIESYFRFMKYSEGEALALSLLAFIDDSRRAALCSVYERLGLPTKLEGCSSRMLIKSILDRFNQIGKKNVDLVLFEDGNAVVKSYMVDEVLDIIESRIAVIM